MHCKRITFKQIARKHLRQIVTYVTIRNGLRPWVSVGANAPKGKERLRRTY